MRDSQQASNSSQK